MSRLIVELLLESPEGIAAVRSTTTVRNGGNRDVVLHSVSSLAAGCFLRDTDAMTDVELWSAESDWIGESRWHRRRARVDILPDLDLETHGYHPRGCVAVTSQGTWSSEQSLPTGALVNSRSGQAWAWQVEHNGPWRCELAERLDGLSVRLSGPTDNDHQWQHRLGAGETFTTVPVGLAVSSDGPDSVLGTVTEYRRAIRRAHPSFDSLPVVFNGYMNTLMGDPTTAKLLPPG